MKTEEDEAFDDLARRQGMWGGGFPAKRQMAMHKTQDQNICRHYKQWQHCHICDLESQVAEFASIKAILDEYGLQAIDFVADFKAALAQSAQEQEEDWGALAEKQLASIKRDTQASFEDAMVRATHQLMVEVEAKLRSKNT